MYGNISFNNAFKREVFVFPDASKDIIAAVAYLKLSEDNLYNISCLHGKAIPYDIYYIIIHQNIVS